MRPVAARVPPPDGYGRIRAGTAAFLGTALLAACGSAVSTPLTGSSSTAPRSASSAARPTPMPTPAPTPTPVPTYPAPVMIQVENADVARPQSGLNQAAMVYEYETEGGISRFSAFYATPPTTQVGPVRSSRLATIQLLRIYGAVLLYSGASQFVQQLLDQYGMPHYNETTAAGDLFRIYSRYAPHNLYTDGGRIADVSAKAKAAPVTWTLWQRTNAGALPPGGGPAATVTVPVSTSERPVFSWHPELSGYTRTEATGLLTDAATGQPLHPSTVVVLQVPVKLGPEVEDVSGTHGLDHSLVGSGPAQVFVGGQQFAATWTQPPSGPPQLTLGNGQPAPLAPGQVWICLLRAGTAAVAA